MWAYGIIVNFLVRLCERLEAWWVTTGSAKYDVNGYHIHVYICNVQIFTILFAIESHNVKICPDTVSLPVSD